MDRDIRPWLRRRRCLGRVDVCGALVEHSTAVHVAGGDQCEAGADQGGRRRRSITDRTSAEAAAGHPVDLLRLADVAVDARLRRPHDLEVHVAGDQSFVGPEHLRRPAAQRVVGALRVHRSGARRLYPAVGGTTSSTVRPSGSAAAVTPNSRATGTSACVARRARGLLQIDSVAPADGTRGRI